MQLGLGESYMRFLAGAVALMASFVAYEPALGSDPTLFCVSEAAGGIAPKNGQWIGTSFANPNNNYLVAPSPSNPQLADYSVTEVGKSEPFQYCKFAIPAERTRLICGGLGWGFIIDFVALRYVEVYTLGYIDNDLSGKNTPAVAGGKCSVIQK
jgi:hypothetical protein